jgi:hypothetical protein
VQLVALADDQVRVELSPAGMDNGFAVRVSVGAGGADTVTVTFLETLPPSPTQSSVKVVVAPSGPVDSEPLPGLLPLQPPLAVQLVALADDQVRVELSPAWMDNGLAVRVSVGAGGADTVTVTRLDALPPSPVQVSAKVVVAVSGPMDSDPLPGLLPLQPPLAVQTVAFLVDQDRVAALPTSTDVGVTDNVIRGLLAGAPQAANEHRDATSPIVSSLARNINFLSPELTPRDARVIPMPGAL